MGLIERFSNNNEMAQKARAYDNAKLQEAMAAVRGEGQAQGQQEGLYAAMVAKANAEAANAPRMPDGSYVNSVQENPVVLPNGEVVSAEQARGLASQMAQAPQPTYRR